MRTSDVWSHAFTCPCASPAHLRHSFGDVRQPSSNAVTDGGATPRAAPTTARTKTKAMSHAGASETPGNKSLPSSGTVVPSAFLYCSVLASSDVHARGEGFGEVGGDWVREREGLGSGRGPDEVGIPSGRGGEGGVR